MLSHAVGKVADSFSPISELSTPHANPTHFWRQEGIYSPPLDIVSQWPGPWCLVGLKAMRTGNHRSEQPATSLYSKSPARLQRGETQGQQCAHGPGSHPLWKRCLSPVPCSLSGGKGLSYTRANSPLCVAVIHAKLYELWSSYRCRQSQGIPPRFT